MDEKKENIICIAEKMFAHYGLKKTTLLDIAKEARMSKATLYYYFKNKEDIFAEVVKKESRILNKELSKSILKSESPKEKLRNYIITRMKHLKKLTTYYSTITDNYLQYTLFVDEVRKEFMNQEMNAIKEILNEGIKSKDFAIKNLTETAYNITLILKGLEFPILIDKKSKSVEKDSSGMIDILLNGINKK